MCVTFDLKQFLKAQSGASAILFALALPAVLGTIGGAVDYAALARQQSAIKNAADSAALSVAREMTMAQMSEAQLQTAAQRFAEANAVSLGLSGLSVKATPTTDRLGLRVDATATAKTPLGLLASLGGVQNLTSSATARVGQQTKLCLLSISEARTDDLKSKLYISEETTGIDLQNGARLNAPGCLIHTNVSSRTALTVGAGAKINAGILCAVGGIQNLGGSVEAAIVDSCPKVPNPMDHRTYPNVKQRCNNEDYKIVEYKTGSHTMRPGNHCGDTIISGDAKVTMLPGNYAFQGALVVRGNAELVGTNVGLYFWGSNAAAQLRRAYFAFLENALIDISAPESGQMAGMLIWEGINGAVTDALIKKIANSNYHQINTARAKRLTGTIYLPAGRLLIDAPVRVAEESDYTVLLVNRLDLSDGPILVLNSNYAKSRVPVPAGLGPLGARNVRLEK